MGAAEAFRLRKAIAEIYDEPLKEREPIENIIFPQKSLNTAYAQYFIGNSYLVPLTGGSLPIHNVTFEPGCLNNWHIRHRGEQILICVGEHNWYQEWGKPARDSNQAV